MLIDLDFLKVDRAHYRAVKCGWKCYLIGHDGLYLTRSKGGRIDCLTISWQGKATMKKGIPNGLSIHAEACQPA